MLRRSLLVFALVTLAAAPALAKRAAAPPPPAPDMPPLEEAIARAKAAGKPLIIDFYTDWCGPCRAFEAKILPDARVQAALGGVVFMRYDAEKGNGIAAATRFRVDSYPTFVVIDGQGKAIARTSGSPDEPTPFVLFVDRGVALSLDEATVNARVKDKSTDAPKLLAAARWLSAHKRVDEAIAVYARAAKADKGGKLGVAPVAEWETFVMEHARAYRKRLVEDAAAFAERWPTAAPAGDAAVLALRSGQLAPARRKKLWAAVIQRHSGSAPQLNSLAYVALATGDYDAALAAAQRALELTPKDASVHDTMAEVFHYRGEKDKAIAASEQALKLNQEPGAEPVLRANRARFAAPGKQLSDDVEGEKLRNQRELDELASGSGLVEVADDNPPSPAEAAKIEADAQLRALQRAAGDAYRSVSRKCAAQAGALVEAYVRVELAAPGGKPTRVIVLEPGVTPALKKCLTDELAKQSFPAAPAAANGRFTAPVKFQFPPRLTPGGLTP